MMNLEAVAQMDEGASGNDTVVAHATGFQALAKLSDEVKVLRGHLDDLKCLVEETSIKKVKKLEQQLDDMVPSITMIGQVKAGKTSLVNAMIGRPDFLPADVNPWTSVVTSLHLNTARDEGAPTATFQLFKQDEWDNLVENGGRLGELSKRANADDELEKVHQQIAEMREKTRRRLGRKFELLLGQKHDFDTINEDLIQRYVCMGDDIEGLDGEEIQQGRFADITKSADIYLEAPRLPLPLCIRDTPGVNDTFLMREQITINALRSSRMCLVVLSAHQALTTTDMAMIRMISNVKSRDLVIFVNRIDELGDPVNQVSEIHDSIRETLAKHNGPKDVEIVFGSAYWANRALDGGLESIVDDSAEAMMKWAEAKLGAEMEGLSPEEMVWRMSGLPELFTTLGNRIASGVANETMGHIRAQALNMASGLQVSSNMVSIKMNGGVIPPVSRVALEKRLAGIEQAGMKALNERLEAMASQFSDRIDQSRKRFLDRALEALLQHLETHGDNKVWQYSADGLRVLLRSSFLVLSRKYATECEAIFQDMADRLAQTYRDVFDVSTEGFSIEPPTVPVIPAPITLGTTIALDLHTSWWRGWWKRRRGYRNYADSYYDLIEKETAPLVEQLDANHLSEIRRNAITTLEDFLDEQGGQLLEVCARSDIEEADVRALFGVQEMQDRDELLTFLIDELNRGLADRTKGE